MLNRKFSWDSLLYGLLNYKNSNFAGDSEDWKLVIRHYFSFNGAIVLGSSKKRKIVFISITKAKYIAFAYIIRENV